MALAAAEKQSIIKDNQRSANDVGSVDVQVALLTKRINDLTTHLQTNEKDHHSRQGLLHMVSRRRGLLDYLKRTDLPSYESLIKKLKIRR